MKTKKNLFALIASSWCFAGVILFAFTSNSPKNKPSNLNKQPKQLLAKGCVFKTVFEG